MNVVVKLSVNIESNPKVLSPPVLAQMLNQAAMETTLPVSIVLHVGLLYLHGAGR